MPAMADPDTLTRELLDTEERPTFDWSRFDWTRLWTPEALRRLAGLGVAIAVVFWPHRSTVLLGRLVGIGLVVYAVPAFGRALFDRTRRWRDAAGALVVLVLGGFLLVDPASTETALGRGIGLGFVGYGAWSLLSMRLTDSFERGWRLTSALSIVAIGVFVAAFPSQLLAGLTMAAAIGWIIVEVISLSIIVDPDRDDPTRVDTVTLIERWFRDRPKTVEDRQRLYRELLYEGPRAQTKIVRFGMLMAFAAIIASMGVVSDSTAVVVGAMLIAPLMTPLMAMALSLAMGWPRRLGRSSLIAFGGIVLAITIGFVIGLADFTLVDTTVNTQIVSRSNPTIVDLITAIAAGAAGSYALSRPDVSNSLPGVAIAIALVPPLTVIGISYSQGDWESGNGALLLFLTNALAILVVGGVMFLLLGVAPLAQATANQYRVRTAIAAIAGASALIVGALALNGTTVASNVFEQRAVRSVVTTWLEPFPEHTTVDVGISGDNVSVVLAGPALEEAPDADPLADELSAELGRDITIDLRIRLELRQQSE
jgi:uncharacterized hydrophobic protein (TIGR00271 family)